MTDYSFIRFKQSLSEAIDLGESTEVTHNYLGQIQLLVQDKQPYWQATNTDFDFNLGTYTVVLIDNCGNEETVTDNVLLSQFTDDNGVAQATVRISDLQTDYGNKLVYLKITHNSAIPSFSGHYYSNLFLVTNNNQEQTTRVDYIDNTRADIPIISDEPFLHSIRLAFYYHNHVSNTELDAYYQITTEQNINSRILENSLKEWYMHPFNAWTFKRLEKAFYNGGFYLNQYRNYVTSPIEYNPREELSNISENTFVTDENENEFLNIIEVSISPSMVGMLSSTNVLSSTNQLSSEITT